MAASGESPANRAPRFVCGVQERQRQLESMGISLETSGIKVGDDKCYLVNLNADPALNELLVYYLKVREYINELLQSWPIHVRFPCGSGSHIHDFAFCIQLSLPEQ